MIRSDRDLDTLPLEEALEDMSVYFFVVNNDQMPSSWPLKIVLENQLVNRPTKKIFLSRRR